MDNMDAGKVYLALRNRYSGDSWAYFEELRTRTGYTGHVGYIDAYSVGLWAANKGFIACEVKVTRGDFKSDIEQFAKKQAIALRNSNQFYYVCPHGLIQPTEVPEVAGLMYVDAAGVKIKKVAQFRELQAYCLDVSFTMALLRASAGKPIARTVPLKYFGKDITEDDLFKLAKEIGVSKDAVSIKHLAREEAAKKRLRSWDILCKFCQAAGIEIDRNYETAEAFADKLVKAHKKVSKEMELSRNIKWAAQRIRQCSEELTSIVSEEEKEIKNATETNRP